MTWPQPLVDDDTYEVVDDAITELARRRGLWMSDANVLHLLASLIAQAERCLPEAVTVARDELSWHDIARLIGTNPVEAQLRFDPASPVADGGGPKTPTEQHDANQPTPPPSGPTAPNERQRSIRPDLNPATQCRQPSPSP